MNNNGMIWDVMIEAISDDPISRYKWYLRGKKHTQNQTSYIEVGA